jgi:hypothetical protein
MILLNFRKKPFRNLFSLGSSKPTRLVESLELKEWLINEVQENLFDPKEDYTIGGNWTFDSSTVFENGVSVGTITELVLGVGIKVVGGNLTSPAGSVVSPGFVVGENSNGVYDKSASEIGVSISGTNATIFDTAGIVTNSVRAISPVGTPAAGVQAYEYTDGRNVQTTLFLSNFDVGSIGGAGNLGLGGLIYSFPAGSHIHFATCIQDVSLAGDAPILADTPEVGLGSVIASGAVATLGGTPTFEDYVTGSAMPNCGGDSLYVKPTGATAGFGMGISLNGVSDSKDLYLNVANNWSGASASLSAFGTITINWTIL